LPPRRPPLLAVVHAPPCTPAWPDAEVADRLRAVAEAFPLLARLAVSPGSSSVHLGRPEVGITLGVESEVPQEEVRRFQEAVAGDEELVSKIDSLAIRLVES